jgi:hypothetical protein
MWNAESAQAWDALYPSEPWAPKRPPFRSLITGLFDTATIAPIHNEYHRDIVLLTLARMLWARMEMAASLKSYFARPTTGAAYGKTDILRAFDELQRADPSSSLSTPGYLARHLQVHHMAQLYAADDLMGWLFRRLRNVKQAANADAELRRWGQDATLVRQTAFHSAQVLAIIRQSPENHTMEPFNAFYAGVTLWYMAFLLREGRTASASAATPIHIDALGSDLAVLPSTAMDPPSLLQAWINAELGPMTVGIHGVPDITAEAGPSLIRDQVMSILSAMSVWKVAHAFCNVFARLEEPFH